MFERTPAATRRCGYPAAAIEAFRAFNGPRPRRVPSRDARRLRLRRPPAHRRGSARGSGQLNRLDATIVRGRPATSVRTTSTMSPQTNTEYLAIGRQFGTLVDGGEFESVFVRLLLFRADRLVVIEQFELEDLDRARARFAELRPDPLRIPPNAAARAARSAPRAARRPRLGRASRRSVRRPSSSRTAVAVSSTAAIVEKYIANAGTSTRDRPGRTPHCSPRRATGSRSTTTLTRRPMARPVRDRDAHPHRGRCPGPHGRESSSSIPTIAAPPALELFERYVRSERRGAIPAALFEMVRAWNAHDLDRFRATLPDDFVFDDHRRTGLGRARGRRRLHRLGRCAVRGVARRHAWKLSTPSPPRTADTLTVGRHVRHAREGGEFESSSCSSG